MKIGHGEGHFHKWNHLPMRLLDFPFDPTSCYGLGSTQSIKLDLSKEGVMVFMGMRIEFLQGVLT